MADNSNDVKEINIRIKFNKKNVKANVTFMIATVAIFILAGNIYIRAGCVSLWILFLVGMFSSDDKAPNTEKENAEKPNKKRVKKEESEVKEIRKPVMPEAVIRRPQPPIHRKTETASAPEPKPAQVAEPESVKEEPKKTENTVTDWADFFDTLDNN